MVSLLLHSSYICIAIISFKKGHRLSRPLHREGGVSGYPILGVGTHSALQEAELWLARAGPCPRLWVGPGQGRARSLGSEGQVSPT